LCTERDEKCSSRWSRRIEAYRGVGKRAENQVKGWSREEAKDNTRHLRIVLLSRHERVVCGRVCWSWRKILCGLRLDRSEEGGDVELPSRGGSSSSSSSRSSIARGRRPLDDRQPASAGG
jgi:hypothetical protein